MMLAFTYVSTIEALLCILCTCVAEFSNPLVPYIVLCVDIYFPYVRIIGGHNSIQHHSFYYYAYEPPCFYIYLLAIYKRNDNFHSSTCVLFYILLLLEQKKKKKKTSSVSCARSKKQRNISIPVYCFNF